MQCNGCYNCNFGKHFVALRRSDRRPYEQNKSKRTQDFWCCFALDFILFQLFIFFLFLARCLFFFFFCLLYLLIDKIGDCVNVRACVCVYNMGMNVLHSLGSSMACWICRFVQLHSVIPWTYSILDNVIIECVSINAWRFCTMTFSFQLQKYLRDKMWKPANLMLCLFFFFFCLFIFLSSR